MANTEWTFEDGSTAYFRDQYGHTSNVVGGTAEGFYRYDTIDADINCMIHDLESMGKNVDGPVTEALLKGAEIIVDSQKKLVPVNTGKLRDAIQVWKPYKNKQGRIVVRCGLYFKEQKDVMYGIFQEFGRVGGKNKEGKEISYMKPTPFIRPGFAFAKDKAAEIVVTAFKAFVDKLMGGG